TETWSKTRISPMNETSSYFLNTASNLLRFRRISPKVLSTLCCIGGEADLGCDSDHSSVTLLSGDLLRGCYLCSGLEFRVQAAHRKRRHRPQRHRTTRKMAANFPKRRTAPKTDPTTEQLTMRTHVAAASGRHRAMDHT